MTTTITATESSRTLQAPILLGEAEMDQVASRTSGPIRGETVGRTGHAVLAPSEREHRGRLLARFDS
jgi:hypothetical protein